ncbi:MAG: DegT/DnrJ/EryC1/StrS family aminotransferase [Gammaproteobacteria bacterium]
MKSIPFFNYPALFAEHETEYMDVMNGVLNRGYYIMGPELAEFEAELARYLGVKHCIGLADGTMALICAVAAAGIKPGDEVLVSAHTFVASAAAIHHCGGKPIPVDCGSDHLMCGEAAKAAVTSKTRGIMPVQLNGRTTNMDPIMELVSEHNLVLVEDSCQALGSSFNGQFAGTFGAAGTFSFYPSKTLGCFGDGGALCTDDDDIVEYARSLRDHGRTSDGDVVRFGYNARLDNIQAAVLLYKLKTYGKDIARRRELAGLYDERLKNNAALHLPPAPDADKRHFDIYQNYEIEADKREALREHLTANGVGTILQWGGKTLQQFPALGMNGHTPMTDEMTKKFMMLPLNTSLSNDDIHYICDQIDSFYA